MSDPQHKVMPLLVIWNGASTVIALRIQYALSIISTPIDTHYCNLSHPSVYLVFYTKITSLFALLLVLTKYITVKTQLFCSRTIQYRKEKC